jgi:hypothetical protein
MPNKESSREIEKNIEIKYGADITSSILSPVTAFFLGFTNFLGITDAKAEEIPDNNGNKSPSLHEASRGILNTSYNIKYTLSEYKSPMEEIIPYSRSIA